MKGLKSTCFCIKKGLKNVTFYYLFMRIHDKILPNQDMSNKTLQVQCSRSLKIFCYVFAKILTREFLHKYEIFRYYFFLKTFVLKTNIFANTKLIIFKLREHCTCIDSFDISCFNSNLSCIRINK